MIKQPVHKRRNRVLTGIMAVLCAASAFFLFWWYGFFLPKNVKWCCREYDYYGVRVVLSDRKMRITGSSFQIPGDWFVQDVLCFDIDCDKDDELVLLVWKHGSYGKHRPIWVEHNDIRLEQHVFIYEIDFEHDRKIRPVWMSSSVGTDVLSIEEGDRKRLVITDSKGNRETWFWQDFGLKYAGEN